MNRPRSLTAAAIVVLLAGAVSAGDLGGTLTVCNAGSLTRVLGAMLVDFAAAHPGVKTAQESAGSLDIVRRATELGRPCDVLVVADYEVLPTLVVPRHAGWYAVFARNRLVLGYRPESRGAPDLDRVPWYEVLVRPEVAVGRADPDTDPAGYRTLLAWQLAERHYDRPGLAARLERRAPARYVRPKSVELVALLETGELDYAWLYRSVAEDAGLRVLALPPEVDLGDPNRAALYATATVEVAGNTPGSRRTVRGLPILYGLTIPHAAPNQPAAEAFVGELLGPRGHDRLRQTHIEPLERPEANDPAAVPASLRERVAPLAFSPPDR